MKGISKLVSRTGSYSGKGVNHEGLNFKGTLNIARLIGGRGVVENKKPSSCKNNELGYNYLIFY